MVRSTAIFCFLVVVFVQDCSAKKDPASTDNSSKNQYDLVRLFAGLYYQNVYGQINSYLVEHVPVKNIGENMAVAKEWLDAEKAKQTFLSRPLIEALEQFTALDQITETNRCNRASYAILYKNNKALNNSLRKPLPPNAPLKRIEYIIQKYCQRHALECVDIYPAKFRAIDAKLDQDARARVMHFLDGYMKESSASGWFNWNQNQDPLRVAFDLRSVYGKNAAKAAFATLQEYTKNDHNRIYLGKAINEVSGKLEVNHQKVGELVDRYLVDSCLHYVNEMGPDLYVPASYDMPIIHDEDKIDIEENRDFFKGWVRFRLCRRLVDKDRNALVKGVISLAGKAQI